MSSSTKQAITQAFIQLAAKKPLEKITVRDIVDACGINRNTFYYHFQDIYAVLEAICEAGTAKINRSLPFGQMLEEFFLLLAQYADSHPKAIKHIAASVGQGGAERYFSHGFDNAVFEALDIHAPHASHAMKRTATVFLRHALLGLYLDLISMNGKISAAPLAHRLGVLANGVLLALSEDAKQSLPNLPDEQ